LPVSAEKASIFFYVVMKKIEIGKKATARLRPTL
jgi:hypothetical protein